MSQDLLKTIAKQMVVEPHVGIIVVLTWYDNYNRQLQLTPVYCIITHFPVPCTELHEIDSNPVRWNVKSCRFSQQTTI